MSSEGATELVDGKAPSHHATPPDGGPQVSLNTTTMDEGKSPREGEEQALETHEVIELQTFSEKKAWIEEKIKLLEGMPPIEVFAGLDAVRTSAETTGLPSRAELQEWLVEHDRIEKETEIFDSGDLKKLKKITKAATQRNLSPEDTDLIELTLTTIYDLDKLLHLLRDRSEHLDLLGTRLTWEENRTAAWADRRKIITDLQTFLATRARWSPSVYDTAPKADETPTARRGSVASMVSMASDTSGPTNPAFSRSARFKLAELLSRDAAQFGAKVTALRHGKISAAGKALDKLIDNSRKPVPEEILDEQDRVEEKGINELEDIGKFVMNVVMQWRKADEIYVETMKDQSAAQNLLEEIEIAKLHHPTARQSASFISRADALSKRLALRGNPASASSTFPRPLHPLFPDQQSSNTSLANSLSSEIASTVDLTKTVDGLAKEYRARFEAVRDAESISQSADDLVGKLTSLVGRLEQGVVAGDGDGTPPDLTSDACLDPMRHSAFLALLPSVSKEVDEASDCADQLLRRARPALLRLDQGGIDPSFKGNIATLVQTLSAKRDQARTTRDDVTARVGRLREARKVWTALGGCLQELQDTRRDIGEAMEKQRWKKQTGGGGTTPLTPESPSPLLPSASASATDALVQLDGIRGRLLENVDAPLKALQGILEEPLHEWLSQRLEGLDSVLGSVRQMAHLLQSIQNQAAVMTTIRDEVDDLQIKVEELQLRFDAGIEDTLVGDADGISDDPQMTADAEKLRETVQIFSDGLAARVPFVARSNSASSNTQFVKRRFSSGDLNLRASQQQLSIELPFELSTLDDAVRADSNSYSLRISSALHSLNQKADHFQLARLAKDVDAAVAVSVDDIHSVSRDLVNLQSSLSTIVSPNATNILESLESLSKQTEDFVAENRSRIGRSFSPVRDLLRRLQSAPGAQDAAVHERIVVARSRAVDDAELKFKAWSETADAFTSHILDARRAEVERQTQERLERERLEAERLEAERIENERLEAERLEAERVEKERIEAERLEAERIEKERVEAERLEAERLEEERLEAERAEKARLEAERLEAERIEKERLEAERLEAERLEAERLEAERIEKERIEAERTEKERLEAERLEQERVGRERAEVEKRELARLEAERLLVEKIEAERLEKERLDAERVEAERIEAERLEAERLELEKKARMEQEQREKEKKEAGRVLQQQLEEERLERERLAKAKAEETQPARQDTDVFGLRVATSSSPSKLSRVESDLQSLIMSLRKRLRSININEVARSSSSLPTSDQRDKMHDEFSKLSKQVDSLPSSAEHPSVDVELQSLRSEMEASADLMQRVHRLADLAQAIYSCDMALSDLLEHIDSFPAAPMGVLSSTHVTDPGQPPDEQLMARLSFTRSAITTMSSHFTAVAEDPRAISERTRILQTWNELEDMGNDRISGRKSRPSSVISSGRNSSASMLSSQSSTAPKRGSYSKLSTGPTRGPSGPGPSNRGRFLSPAHATSRRAVSGSSEAASRPSSRASNISTSRSFSGPMFSPAQARPRHAFAGSVDLPSRSSSRMSTASNRSVSGPMFSPSSSLYSSTFASRQRTTSLSSNGSTPARTPVRRTSALPPRPRAQTGEAKRASAASPTVSDASSLSRSAMSPSRSSTSMSSWARAPRHSLSSILQSKITSPPRRTPAPKKPYIANPKNKLDVAVGDVVNKLPVNINIEMVGENWKDQSGKYWIGDQEPKLCFCRILRSQTVMVRVGGGWSELSKFIKDHFADQFRLVTDPQSPSRMGTREEKWISSATLLEAPEIIENPHTPPRTPEPTGLPSFVLSTPSGQSPRSLRSTPSTGSPLTPLQFMRRAEDAPGMRPVTPSRSPRPHSRARSPPVPSTPSRSINAIWRP
ncbi:hypothetical protein PLICRDRAFT_129845 [Plicaturopsis crispa FD-325 SS-3]|nr:hypothetical protein PLICRDRAFT_129845 [Plicaturopsis crispa FD-325 SS-3]